MKRKFVKDSDGHLCLVTEVTIDKNKELESLDGNIEAMEREVASLMDKITELKAIKDELLAAEV